MNDILLLTHRIPWPPDKGDKIRSYHFFRHLAENYRLHLATFVDCADDWSYVPELEKRCASVCVRPTGRLRSLRRGVRALWRGKSVTMDYYDDKEMSRWVLKLGTQCNLQAAVGYSAGMAGYLKSVPANVTKILDMVDVDSEKWREYASRKSQPMRWVYSREARLLSGEETDLVEQFDRTLLVSDDEVELLRRRVPAMSRKISAVPNGVDSEFFTPAEYASPYPDNSCAIVFTGAMDYWANIEGVSWFATSIFPRILKLLPQARFYIVGSNPTTDVCALANLPGVEVSGRVPDVRPYLAHARVVVAPLRIARGLQNKVLEAMAMARPVVATTAAMRGIDNHGSGARIANTEEQFVASVSDLVNVTQVLANRDFVKDHFSWAAALNRLEEAMGNKKNIAETDCA